MAPMIRVAASAVLAACLAACSHVPAATPKLSAAATDAVAKGRTAHLELVDRFAEERRGRVDDHMRYAWTPEFLRTLLKKTDFAGLLCKSQGEADRALLVQEFIEAAVKQIEKRRTDLLSLVETTRVALRAGVQQHWDGVERMQRTVTANLEAARAGDQLGREALQAAGVDAAPLEALDSARLKLEQALREGGPGAPAATP